MKIAEKKKKFKKSIAGIGLISIIVGSVILATIVAGGTKWLVSMQQATINNEDRMTAMSLAYNKWQEYAAKSYDNISSEARRTTTNDKFDIDSTVGGEHTLDGGGLSKPVTITVYKAGTTNVAYAMVAEKVKGVLTFEDEIDRLEKEINSLSDRLTNAINNINDKDAQQDAEIAALKAQIANIQSQIDSLNLRVSNDESNTASRIAELQNLLNELNAKLTELSSQDNSNSSMEFPDLTKGIVLINQEAGGLNSITASSYDDGDKIINSLLQRTFLNAKIAQIPENGFISISTFYYNMEFQEHLWINNTDINSGKIFFLSGYYPVFKNDIITDKGGLCYSSWSPRSEYQFVSSYVVGRAKTTFYPYIKK